MAFASPRSNRDSMISKIGSGSRMTMMNGGAFSNRGHLDLHKKTGIEVRESPSKGAKIVMKYINNYADVGPIKPKVPISYQNLEELAKNLDKREVWTRSDLRLIFAVDDCQILDESIEQLNKILRNE